MRVENIPDRQPCVMRCLQNSKTVLNHSILSNIDASIINYKCVFNNTLHAAILYCCERVFGPQNCLLLHYYCSMKTPKPKYLFVVPGALLHCCLVTLKCRESKKLSGEN